MLRRPHYIGLGLVVLMTLIIFNLPDQTTARLKLGIGSLFLPLFGLAGSAQEATGRVADALVPRGELLKQNEALRRDNQQLRLRVMQAEETTRENARLRQQVGWQPPHPGWKVKLGKVVLREPANWWRTVRIDLGSRDGLSTNLPVLTPDGLVGRVASVGLTSSQVILVGDPFCKVFARVENGSGDTGVIVPAGPLDSGLVALSYLPPNANVKPGQRVVTSGKGGIYPEGIVIGQIVDTHSAEYGLATEARVKLAANLNALEEVFVCLSRD